MADLAMKDHFWEGACRGSSGVQIDQQHSHLCENRTGMVSLKTFGTVCTWRDGGLCSDQLGHLGKRVWYKIRMRSSQVIIQVLDAAGVCATCDAVLCQILQGVWHGSEF